LITILFQRRRLVVLHPGAGEPKFRERTFAAVPALQSRLIGVAETHAPNARGVAAGLNIAGFNSGIAVGSVLGGLTISATGIAYTGVTGGVAAGLGLFLLITQMIRDRGVAYKSVLGSRH
jgi:DHA1 family inner membrane transport protein